ncbi:replication factor C subunit 4 [Pichia californica]|uniref:Replication factor C subunit 4 n=1 Tax=Pichia californica TaxID=460514 RepID=A0A9P7BEF7_9ASCO|nr:replication factor C subunit 4 [[Candida] californica]KAG0687826.1 replication factor C subunit 4 [[Candida] californica]
MTTKKYPLELELPWVEKYRPKYLDEVVGNVETINALKRISKDGNLPHLILSGSPGIGKTTTILCLARELFNNDEKLLKEGILELNASDDRGIEIVRNLIKNFSQKKVLLPYNRHKIIILDEADSITSSAQQALRRTMEIYSNSTRFIFSCNQSNKIIEPLQSRCSILRFNKLKDEEILIILKRILKNEGIESFTNDGLSSIIFTSDGDLRQAINNLQSVYYGFKLINSENVFKIVDLPNPLIVNRMIKECLNGEIDKGLTILKELWNKGYSAIDIINVCFKVCKTINSDDNIDNEKQLKILRNIGECQMRVVEGVSSFLQLSSMLVSLCDV